VAHSARPGRFPRRLRAASSSLPVARRRAALGSSATTAVTGTAAPTLESFTSSASGTVWNPPAVVYVKEVGFVTNSSAGTTSAITVASGGVPADDTIVIYGACDNTGASGIATTISVADNSSQSGTANTYTLQTPQAIADPGAASAGQQGFFVVCTVTRPLLAGDTITVTFGNSTTAKAINAQQFTGVHRVSPVLSGTYARQDNQTSTTNSVAATPTAANQAVCALIAVEGGTADSFTEDADTTNGAWVTLTRRGSGTTTSGSTLNSVYKIVTASGSQTYDPTLGTARDHCAAILVLDAHPTPVTGTAAPTLDAFTSAASGTVSAAVTGTVDVTLAAFTSDASGTSAGPSFTGTVAVTLADVVGDASGQVGQQGTAAPTLDAFTSSASGTHDPPPVSGTVAVTLANVTADAAGTFTPAPITGTVDVTLAAFTSDASGTSTPPGQSGTVAVTLEAFASSAAGQVGQQGTAAPTLDAFTSSASGTHTPPPITGSVAVTLESFTGAASGSSAAPGNSGSSAATLDNLTSTASGTHTPPPITGTAAVTLAPFVPSASGEHTPPAFTGTTAVTLAPFTSSASGTVAPPAVTGVVVAALDAFTAAATGSVTAIVGTVAVTLQPFVAAASDAPPDEPGTVTLAVASPSIVLAATAPDITLAVASPSITLTVSEDS
jgi:hypothetical protein